MQKNKKRNYRQNQNLEKTRTTSNKTNTKTTNNKKQEIAMDKQLKTRRQQATTKQKTIK